MTIQSGESQTEVTEPAGTPAVPTVRKNEAGQYVLKSKGGEKVVSEDELFQLAQLSFGANAKFEEAANLRKETDAKAKEAATKALGGLRNLLQQAEQGDAVAYEKYLEFLGVEEDDRVERLAAYQQAWGGGDVDEPTETPRPTAKGQMKAVDPRMLPKEVQELLKAAAEVGGAERLRKILGRADETFLAQDRERVHGEIWSEVEKDQKLKHIVDKGGPRVERLRKLSKTLVRSRIQDGAKWGPELRAEVVKELREYAEDLGAGASTENPLPGIGLTPGLSQLVSQAERKPERKAITDPGYMQNIAEQLVFEAMNAGD